MPTHGTPAPGGKNPSGSQRDRCAYCKVKYTPNPKPWAYDPAIRLQAVRLYVDGMNLRRIGRHLGVHHRTVSLWVQAYAAQLPPTPQPENVQVGELDELFTFIGDKKSGSTS